MTETLESPRIIHDLPDDVYHRRELGVASYSALKRVLRSPAHYRAWLEEPEQSTPAMEFGRLFHLYTLETEKCLATVAVEPEFGDCRVKINKEHRDQWRAENANKRLIGQEDWDRCRRMGDAVRSHPIAARLIEQAATEISMFWTDPVTGLQCKARVDGWGTAWPIAIDLKTCEDASPRGFEKAVANFDYHMQNAFYVRGLEQNGHEVKAFRFIAVEKEPPYAVMVHELDAAAVWAGELLASEALATLKRCIDSDDWPAYGVETNIVSLPKWKVRS